MKTTRVILTILCVALILCMPIFLSSPIKPTPRKGSEDYERIVKENIENAPTEDEEFSDDAETEMETAPPRGGTA